MKFKKFMRNLIAFALVVCFCLLPASGIIINVSAQETDYTAENKAKDFIISVYDAKGFTYNNLTTLYSVELYYEEDNVIAQASLFDRDGKIDYAVYNYITASIDEYGFDCPDVVSDFPENEKTYYAGIYSYFSKNSGQLRNNSSEQVISEEQFIARLRDFKQKSYDRYEAKSGNSTKPGNGNNGIINWKEIRENRTSGWENTASGYLEGITCGTTESTSGINGLALSFKSADYFQQSGSITNHCGPTALTNIMIYYEWLGMNTMLNNSAISTFYRLRTLCKHDVYCTTYMSDARSAIQTYMSEMGYSVTLTNFGNEFDQYKEAIDNDKVVLTLLNVVQENGYEWGHYVVTLGYEEFRQAYEKQILWWTVTEYNYLRYIRVCDGWSTKNQNRYVDLNNFYDSYLNSAITIN